jgi:hypothetical protein
VIYPLIGILKKNLALKSKQTVVHYVHSSYAHTTGERGHLGWNGSILLFCGYSLQVLNEISGKDKFQQAQNRQFKSTQHLN